MKKGYNEFKLQYNKQPLQDILIQRAEKTTIQTLYDKRLFDGYANAEKILGNFLFTTRHRGDFEEVNDVVL